MSRRLPTAVLALVLTLFAVPVVSTSPAAAEPQITQNAKLRQIRYFSLDYRRACPTCKDVRKGTKLKVATATINGKVATYRLSEQNKKWDFYFVDADYAITRRKGDEDWGSMDVRITSAGKVKARHPAYSNGLSAVDDDDCRTYDVGISAGFLGISAGTQIASFSTCAKGATIAARSIERGRWWRLNKVSGSKTANFRQFVQVPAGQHPKFRISTITNHDSGKVRCARIPNGSGSGTVYTCWIERDVVTSGFVIATTR